MKTFNVGLLGFGMIGKVHAYGYLNLPFVCDPVPLRARITHVVTARPETAERARQTVGADVAATDYRAVTESPAIDIVHVCTPNYLHKDALLSAMAHGKHVYCDKPLVATMAEADEIAAALPSYRAIGQMTFQNRFFPATLRAKQLADEGRLGQVLSFCAAYLHGGNANPAAPLKWKLQSAAGGGVIADLASHVLDLVDWLIGPFRAVAAATKTAYPERPSPHDPRIMLPSEAEDGVAALAAMQSVRWARSRPPSWPPAPRTKSGWKFTGRAARCGSTAWRRTISGGTTRRRPTSRWAACGAGTGSTAAGAIPRRRRGSPRRRPPPAGSKAMSPAWPISSVRWPPASRPSRASIKASASSA